MRNAAGLFFSVALAAAPCLSVSSKQSKAVGPPLSAASHTAAQQRNLRLGRNSIYGYVYDSKRNPQDNLRIELLDDSYSVLTTVRTNNTGSYRFDGVGSGTFQVRVEAPGSNLISQTERIYIGGLGVETISQDFYLKTREEEKLKVKPQTAAPGTVFAQSVPEAAKQLYEKGIKNLGDEKTAEQGLVELKQAIEAFPNYYFALDLLGTEYLKRGHHMPALVLLTKAVEVNPRGYSSVYRLGLAQYHTKRTDDAIETLRRSLTINSNAIGSHLWLGIALRRAGKPEQAEVSLKKAIELSSSKPIADAYWQLALVYNDLKRYKESADQLELFLQTTPDARDTEKIREMIKTLREKAQ